jgi:hypothetical protein
VLAVKQGPAHFEALAALCDAGEVRIHIDRTFTLDEVPAALAHVGEGRALGKVVIAPPNPVESNAAPGDPASGSPAAQCTSATASSQPVHRWRRRDAAVGGV